VIARRSSRVSKRFPGLIALLSFALLALATPATQAATLGPATAITEFSPVRTINGEAGGTKHATAVNPKTGAQIVFYNGLAAGATNRYLGAQLFTADGPVGPEHVVVTGDQHVDICWQPSVAYNPTTGGWLVAYPDNQTNEIIGQKLNADGSNSGASFVIGSITSPSCSGVKINWSGQSKKFLVTFGSGYVDVMKARFVSGSGAPLGSTFVALDNTPASYCPMDTAHSSKSNTYLATVGAECTSDPAKRPLVQFLSSTGDRVGSERFLGDASWEYDYGPSIAYNAKLDEFGVFWQRRIATSPVVNSAIYLQRIDASNGADIGAPVQVEMPTNSDSLVGYGNRIRVSASPSGTYYLSARLIPGGTTVSAESDWYSFKVGGTGQTVANSLEDVGNGVTNTNRPQTLYNPVTGQFLSTFSASECVPNAGSATRSTRGVPCTNAYDLYANGAPGTPPTPSSGPSLKKAGTPGGTSLTVRVGCAGGGSCKVQLGGRLIGGTRSAIAKLRGKTVKIGSAGTSGSGSGSGTSTITRAKASRTVTLAYTSALIRQLAQDGGGKIRVKARQVGGGSKTITLTVPASVTG